MSLARPPSSQVQGGEPRAAAHAHVHLQMPDIFQTVCAPAVPQWTSPPAPTFLVKSTLTHFIVLHEILPHRGFKFVFVDY